MCDVTHRRCHTRAIITDILQGETRIFYRQLSGLPMGACYSDSFASLGVVLKEAILYKKINVILTSQNTAAELVLKARFVDDTLPAMLMAGSKVKAVIAALEVALSEMYPCISFTQTHETYSLPNKKSLNTKSFPFLELNLFPTSYPDGCFVIEHAVNVKDKSPYAKTF